MTNTQTAHQHAEHYLVTTAGLGQEVYFWA
jgi:hypothetical protein